MRGFKIRPIKDRGSDVRWQARESQAARRRATTEAAARAAILRRAGLLNGYLRGELTAHERAEAELLLRGEGR